jgi:hypothetical protein
MESGPFWSKPMWTAAPTRADRWWQPVGCASVKARVEAAPLLEKPIAPRALKRCGFGNGTLRPEPNSRSAPCPRWCLDRSLVEMYDRSTVAPANLFYLVRSQHDRVLEGGEKLWDHLAAQPCGGPKEPFVDGPFDASRFSSDGHWIIADTASGGATTMEIPIATNLVPVWLPDLAEAVAGKRINEQGIAESMPPRTLAEFKEQLARNAGTAPYARWAGWFFADRATRGISPSSLTMVSAFPQGDFWPAVSLEAALQQFPTNALAMAQLAVRLSGEPDPNQTKAQEADWLSRRAAELAPADPEVSRIRERFEERARELARGKSIKNLNRFALRFAEKIEQLLHLVPRPPETDHN